MLTNGASATDPFRFLDEGWATVLEARAANREAEYAEEAMAIAAMELKKGGVGFDLLQRWSEYFGDWQGVDATKGAARPRNFDAYRVGASFDLWLVQRYGEPKLRELLVAIGRSRDLRAALVEVLGRPAAEVEAEWKAKVSATRIPDDPPGIVELSPANGATGVATDRTEITARFSVPMNRSILSLGADCESGICYTHASWTSPTVLTVRLPTGLKGGTSYVIRLGVEQQKLRSRYGKNLPVTT